jgi:DNA-binding transcriptional LysR family regulator
MLTWDDHHLLLTIARSGTLSTAAKRLGVNETTVSRRLAAAEARAHATLLQRKNGRLVPTALGRAAVSAAEAMERAYGEIADTSGERGSVRISAVAFVIDRLIAPALPDFNRRHPRITLELVASNEQSSLTRREADIALRMARPASGRLVSRQIGNIPLYLAAKAGTTPTHYMAYEQDLDDMPEMQAISSYFGGPPIVRLSSLSGMAAAAAAGCGAAMLPKLLISERQGLAVLDPSLTVNRPVWLVVHEDQQHRPLIRNVIRWLALVLPRAIGAMHKPA